MLAPQRTVLGKCIKRLSLEAASARDMGTPRGRCCSTYQSESSWDEDTCIRGTHSALGWTPQAVKVDMSGEGRCPPAGQGGAGWYSGGPGSQR